MAAESFFPIMSNVSEEKVNTAEGEVSRLVPVPSSEHVAVITGKQGNKIKKLQIYTNTYIKTPDRKEEPVFLVLGKRKEDVDAAEMSILREAEYYSQSITFKLNERQSTANTAEVHVSYHLVGFVVGHRGTTIHKIQEQSGTFISTPSREEAPIFRVTGAAEDIKRAKEKIDMLVTLHRKKPLVNGNRPDVVPSARVNKLAWTNGRPDSPGFGCNISPYGECKLT